MKLTITARVLGAIRRDAEANVFVSFCPSLHLYSQGRTKGEAKAALESAVGLFLSVCYDRGILDQALQKRGFAEASRLGISSSSDWADECITIKKEFPEAFEFEVPLHLIASASQEAPCQHLHQ